MSVEPAPTGDLSVGPIDGVSIIIPTFNRAELLAKALDSVQQLRVPGGLCVELLIIDNNSTDETSAVVAAAGNGEQPIPVRRVVEMRQGLSWARNRGIAEAAFQHLVFLDDDMLVDQGWLEGYVEAQHIHQACCVIGPVIPQFEVDPPQWLTPSMVRSVTGAYSLKGDEMIVLGPGNAHQLPGCNFSVLRAAAIKAGGFSTELGRAGKLMLGGEDWEFGEKVVKLGNRVVYAPKCRIKHFISRNKISRDGLRARWEGMGASDRAMMALRGQRVSLVRRLKSLWWMSRCFVTGRYHRLIGDDFNAFHWELQECQNRGFLFKAPKVEPRQWPPVALDIGRDD